RDRSDTAGARRRRAGGRQDPPLMSVARSPGCSDGGPARLRDGVADGVAEVEARTPAGLAPVEDALATAVWTAAPFVREVAGALIAAGGKRFRPTCVLLAGQFG